MRKYLTMAGLAIILTMLIMLNCKPKQDISIIIKHNGVEIDNGETFDFGEAEVGQSSDEETFIIQNTGETLIEISEIIVNNGRTHFNFNTDNIPTSLESNEETTFSVVYEPMNSSDKSSSIDIMVKDSTEASYSLTFIGTTPPDIWEELTTNTSPEERCDSAIAFADDYSEVFIFGGRIDISVPINADDTWKYNIDLNQWEQLSPIGNPPARRASSMAYIGNDIILLFGGLGDGDTRLNDIWEYNIVNNEWTELYPSGSIPTARSNSGMTAIGDNKLMIYGGSIDGSTYSDEIWVYDYNTNEWTEQIPSSTTNPPARSGKGLVYTGNDKVMLFGGSGGYPDYYNDLWEYDITTKEWMEITPTGDVPVARTYFGMSMVSEDKFLVFGGFDDQLEYIGDTWEYDITANEWTEFSSIWSPSNRGFPSMTYIGNNKIVMFGGMIPEGAWVNLYKETLEFYTGE
jgi:N-acetylneuraminic acid mutarotase